MWAAVVVLLGSAAAAVLLVPVVPVLVLHEPLLPAQAGRPREPDLLALALLPVVWVVLVQVPPGLRVLVLAQAPPVPLLLDLLSLPLPQVVVASEVPLLLQGRPSFSA